MDSPEAVALIWAEKFSRQARMRLVVENVSWESSRESEGSSNWDSDCARGISDEQYDEHADSLSSLSSTEEEYDDE